MLINSSRLINCPVLSLHVGGQIARVIAPIIDPNTLKIIACQVDGPLVGKEMGEILPMASVREFSRLGMLVDSADEFVEPDGIVRVREVLELDFSLIGLKVETKRKVKLGKVTGYTLEPENWQIQQLIVQRPLLKAFFDPELTISRSQVIEVNDTHIIVKDTASKAQAESQAESQADFVPSFINPFRESELATDSQAKQVSEPESQTQS